MASNTLTLAQMLEQGAHALGVPLDAGQQAQLLHYVELLQKWNKVYNLTAVRDPQEMMRLHLLDCLAVVRPFQVALQKLQELGLPAQVLDVGAGGGLPGVVLAICCPQVHVQCVDAVAKKMAFVRQAGAELKLPNLQATHARVESLGKIYSLITSRAFASLSDFVGLTTPLLHPQGVWMAMKGKHPQDEILALPSHVNVFHVEQLQIPEVDAERCLVWMRTSNA
ncbi:16S rRNA (guanine(527)-N(7))-methyltransferase RsmG [Lampropedia puyangensis]|uniref:Ribosomal RNA small subunit methyltransferase G n=1 Tax=Lampropedia puyangensis TaxID=1330072 RepID=A0A4S8EP25_9BURK|nr:16S rRNA (guanine(527)-N(7))-methyltransferase RsmG [Lampropedia puyangensis]THT96402.1 16S rRNA (guanine(527)-N(7))-methyltransferase RsmG [Lampropedia puyangensis]